MRAKFHIHGSLHDFLPPERRGRSFEYSFLVPGSVKDMFEAIGPPHPEVELALCNGEPVGFDHLVRDGDEVAVFPYDLSGTALLAQAQERRRFVLDVHLGTLAGYLRLAGFDALYRNNYDDSELARDSSTQGRTLLTRDRGLLRRQEIEFGYFVRATTPAEQLEEVLRRFRLLEWMRPFSRCLKCNGSLREVDAEDAKPEVPARVAASQEMFWSCEGCRQLFWKGSHYEHMERFVRGLVAKLAA